MTAKLVWQAEEVIRAVGGQCLHEQTWEAHGVSINTRTIQPLDLFIALVGGARDGHDYVAEAFEKGASAAIVSRQPPQVAADAPVILVEDTFTALENLGRAGRQRCKADIVAVTGSVGKTSSKEMLRVMLNAVGETYANEGNLNNQWGVPLSLSRMPAQARYGVFELGMNHAGELTGLSQQVRPDVALITTIEAVHLEFFASLDAIADAKAEVFLGMNANGAAVLNRDNAQFARLAAGAKNHGLKKILGFGRDGKADARMLNYAATPDGSEIEADILGRKINYSLTTHGEHLALNSLGALLAAVAAGGDLDACVAALAHYRQPAGRGGVQTIILAEGNITVIDESYNASPAAVRAAVHVLGQKTPPVGGHRILVLGDMKELGTEAHALHAGLASDIIKADITRVFCCGEMMAYLYEALPPNLRGAYAPDSAELTPHVISALHAGDIITVKGSHSMNMNLIVDALKALGEPALKSHKLAS